ncbi:MAG: bifunctional metallophosphatase/5'-nucleotidase [Gammaproteobacteria bacterium]|nr:bifunctional metallophosphatase/5'-nucleotidase [Gammaproteobacteria bacterium]
MAFAFAPLIAVSKQTSEHNLTIIFSGNMNEISSDKKSAYPQLSYLLKKHRNKPTPVFFFFGGGSIGPSMLATFDRGSHIVDLLNQVEPDVMATTKRDFSFLEDELSLRAYEAAFPIVATNLIDVETNNVLDGLSTSVITRQGDYSIGVLSTLSERAIQEYNLTQVRVLDKAEAVKKHASLLRQQGVDLVALINTGIKNDVIQLLEDNIVDLILQKDSNVDVRKDQYKPNHSNYIFVSSQDEFAVVNVRWQEQDVQNLNVSTEYIRYQQLFKDAEMQQVVEQYESRLDNLLDEVIGNTQTSFRTQRNLVRRKENEFGNLLTDALKQYAKADIAIINGGTIRGERNYIRSQQITRRDVISELPYRSNIELLELSGDVLQQTIEHGLSGIDSLLGRFLQVSGIKFTYNSQKPPGQRLLSLTHNGQPVTANKVYKVATSEYLAGGGDDFTMLLSAPRLDFKGQKNILVSDVLVNHIRTANTIAPALDRRIIDISKSNLSK